MSNNTFAARFWMRALRLTGPLLLALAVVAVFLWLDGRGYLSLTRLQAEQQALAVRYRADAFGTAAGFFLAALAFTSLSIPGGALFSLLAGALFGVFWGTVLMSFASSLGATVALLATRHLLRAPLQHRFAAPLALVDRGIRRDGAYFLLALRLTPVFPFFMVNVLMGLTRMRVRTYYWVSQLGMLPITLLYVNAGRRLRDIRELDDVLTPQVLLSLALLGIFPLLSRVALRMWRTRGD